MNSTEIVQVRGRQVWDSRGRPTVEAEVTGLERDIAHCLPFSDPIGIATGTRALAAGGTGDRIVFAGVGKTFEMLQEANRLKRQGLDVVIGGSQKAFMVPPGLAFMSVSPKAWNIGRQLNTLSCGPKSTR